MNRGTLNPKSDEIFLYQIIIKDQIVLFVFFTFRSEFKNYQCINKPVKKFPLLYNLLIILTLKDSSSIIIG